jgi:hypothetical protein
VARGEAWFVNWADFPSVVPIADRLWAAHWLARRPEGGYAYDVAMALSSDAGARWGATLSPHTDGTPTEHGFVTLFPWQGGVGAVWLDGRNMQPGEAGDLADHGHGEGGMTLRSVQLSPPRSEAGAAVWSAGFRVGETAVSDLMEGSNMGSEPDSTCSRSRPAWPRRGGRWCVPAPWPR